MLNINVVSEELLAKLNSLCFWSSCADNRTPEITMTKGMLIYHDQLDL